MDLAMQVELLRNENDSLAERVAALEAQLGRIPLMFPPEWRLTVKEAGVLGALLARALASKEFILIQLYDGRDEAEAKIVDVFICKIRRKLLPFGIEIITEWGRGYRLTDDSRKIIRKAVGILQPEGSA